MQVTLKSVSPEKCNKMYEPFGVSLKAGQMCAGGEEGFDSCKGKIQVHSNYSTNLHELIPFKN